MRPRPLTLLFLLPALANGLQLELAGDLRLRFETIDGNMRAGADHDDLLLSRVQMRLLGRQGRHTATVELIDSRQWLADNDTPLNTGMVNTRELKQFFVNLQFDAVDVAVGRMTREDNTRRLLARNKFRNTANTFNGVDFSLTRNFGTLRTFYLRPAWDRPRAPWELRDNRYAADGFDHAQNLWGIEYARAEGAVRHVGLFSLHESDREGRPTRDRLVRTLSGLATFPEAWRKWTLSWHAAFQWGRTALDVSQQATRLSHRAYFSRLAAKRGLSDTLDLTVSFDYTTGDEDPLDSRSERFDTLFGVQRFEWGPGSLYGALRRSNVVSPGIRLDVRRPSLNGDLTYRPVWLAARKDTWAGIGLRDPSGRAGRFLGHQLDGRVRFKVRDWLAFDVGGAVLKHGNFVKRIRQAEDRTTSYGYVQMTARF